MPGGLLDSLAQTWPARLAKDVWSGITLPRDVYQGAADPDSAEAFGRVMGLAGMMVGSPLTPRGALGSGMARVNGPERLERAAIRIGDQIFAGPNHVAAIRAAENSTGKGLDELIGLLGPNPGEIDGFVTSAGRFVPRTEASRIAEQAAQLKPQYGGSAPDSALMTEDMRRGAIWSMLGLVPAAGFVAGQERQ